MNQFKSAERIAQRYGIGRDRADEFGGLSQQRAAAAWAQGRFDSQVITGPAETEDGEPVSVARDEGLRDTSLDKLAELKPVLPDGIHTAGTSSQISDGASAVLLMTQDRAARLGLTPLAGVVDSLLVGVDPVMMLLGPHAAVPALLERNGLALDDIGLIEINEAFASVVISFADELKADPAVINPNGGAIALGHPLGATGCVLITKAGYGRIVTTTTSASGLFGNFGQANYDEATGGQVGRGSGQILSAGGGHVSAVLVSVTRGITAPHLSAEAVRDRLKEILDPAGSVIPRHIGDDLKQLFAALEAGPA